MSGKGGIKPEISRCPVFFIEGQPLLYAEVVRGLLIICYGLTVISGLPRRYPGRCMYLSDSTCNIVTSARIIQ